MLTGARGASGGCLLAVSGPARPGACAPCAPRPEPGGQPSWAVCVRNLVVCLHGHAGPMGVIPAEAHRQVAHVCPLSLSVHTRPCLWTCVCFSRDLMPVHRLTSDGKQLCWGWPGQCHGPSPGLCGRGTSSQMAVGSLRGWKGWKTAHHRAPFPGPLWSLEIPQETARNHSQEVNATQRAGGRPASQNLEVGTVSWTVWKRSPARCVLGPLHRGPQNKPSPADPRVPAGPVPPPCRPSSPGLPYLPGQVRFCSKATDMAQSSILRRMKPDWAAASWIRSMNFSHTRGTPMCDVGSTSRSVFTRLPCPAPGREARRLSARRPPHQRQGRTPTASPGCPLRCPRTLAHAMFRAVCGCWAAVPTVCVARRFSAAWSPASPLSSLT